MNRFIACLVVSLACLLPQPSVAGEYVYRDGYWWCDGVPYVRKKVWDGYCRRWVYRYERVHIEKQVVISPRDPDWRDKLAEAVAYKVRLQAKLLKEQEENRAFIEAIQALGGADALPPGYSVEMPYTVSGATYSVRTYPALPQGTTLYGYQQLSNAYSYEDVDLQALLHAQKSYVQSALKLTEKTQELFADSVNRVTQSKKELAEAEIKARVLEQVTRSLFHPKATEQKWEIKLEPKKPVGQPEPDVSISTSSSHHPGWSVIVNKCVRCHNKDEAKGGLALDSRDAFTPDVVESVVKRVTTTDSDLRMPKGGNLTPAEQLSLMSFLSQAMETKK